MDRQANNNASWSENIIIADADYLDSVAFDLTVNFERMIGRPIAKADMAQWIDCVALDGGIRPGEHDTQVVLIHHKDKMAMENFVPAHHEQELNAKAFKDHLGEFVINSFPVEEVVSADDFFIEILQTACAQKQVRRIMVIPNAEKADLYNRIRNTLRHVEDEDKRITVFAMQPMQGGNFKQEILGYSLMNALDIRADELNPSPVATNGSGV